MQYVNGRLATKAGAMTSSKASALTTLTFAIVFGVIWVGCFPKLADESDTTESDVVTTDVSDANPQDLQANTSDGDQEATSPDSEATDTESTDMRDGVAVTPPGRVGNVRASTDRSDGVLVSWDPVENATTYRIYRGETTVDVDAGLGASWLDSNARPPGAYGAPTALTASDDDVLSISLSWTAPAVPKGPTERYRVEALNNAGSGGTSTEATGNTVASAITGWEIKVNATPWRPTDSIATTFVDTSAPAPTVEFDSAAATQGAHHAFVALSVAQPSVAGVTVTYTVRGKLADASYTPDSGAVSGQRDPEGIVCAWSFAETQGAATWTSLVGESIDQARDDAAPMDGSSRFYRVEARAGETLVGASNVVEGWRLAFAEVSGGSRHFCARTTRGAVWCWGSNEVGQLGRGTTSGNSDVLSPAVVEGLDGIIGLASGRNYNIAWRAAGDAVAWGRGLYLDGLEARNHAIPATLHLSSIATASLSNEAINCAVDTAGRIWCWGLGAYLGDGTFDNQLNPRQVLLGTSTYLTNVDSVSSTSFHTCALTNDGDVHCWGEPGFGRTGSTAPAEGGFHLRAQPAVPGLGAARSIAVNSRASCAVLLNGHVYCWGADDAGAGATGTAPLRIEGLTNAVEIAGRATTFCARRENGTIWCWGGNSQGSLGRDSDVTYSATAGAVVGNHSFKMIGSGGYGSFCAITETYQISCWGSNWGGQLGDGTIENRFVPVPVVLP